MKRFIITAIICTLSFLPALAERVLVDVTPVKKISTAKNEFLEGDFVDFRVVGTDKLVRGLIVKYQENGFAGKEAQLTIDNFRAINSNEKYSGTIFLRGNFDCDDIPF